MLEKTTELNLTQLNERPKERWLKRKEAGISKKLIAYIYPRFLNKQLILALKVLTDAGWQEYRISTVAKLNKIYRNQC